MSRSIPRRLFLGAGLAAVGGFLTAPSLARAFDPPLFLRRRPSWITPTASAPIRAIAGMPAPLVVDGLPFHPAWLGDNFGDSYLPFHTPEAPPTWSQVDERVDVAIIGGGLAGLACARELRGRDWVVMDLRERFGGNAIGESWNHLPYSLGSAYFMMPDKGSDLDRLYQSLGVYELARIDDGTGFRVEYGGQILDDLCKGCTADELAALARYRAAVTHYAEIEYPEIPWTSDASRRLVRTLDAMTLHESIALTCKTPMPGLLAKSLQAYCYSSFGVGWDELSAAAGWNFVAAEEYGRIVLPGGNAGLATLLWNDLMREGPLRSDADRLRAGCIATSVKVEREGVAIAWRGTDGVSRTLGARHVIYAGSKHILRHMMPDLPTIDPAKLEATQRVHTVPYIVANVLVTRRVREEFYDIFAVHDEAFPMNDESFEQDRRITDALDGAFAVATPHMHGDVLTLYWPLPWHTARFTIINEGALAEYASRAAPQIHRLLALVGLAPSDVASIRMARWGHAMPWAPPGSYADELCYQLRAPVQDRVWFANQDNWLLPAVETCLTEAAWVAKQLD